MIFGGLGVAMGIILLLVGLHVSMLFAATETSHQPRAKVKLATIKALTENPKSAICDYDFQIRERLLAENTN